MLLPRKRWCVGEVAVSDGAPLVSNVPSLTCHTPTHQAKGAAPPLADVEAVAKVILSRALSPRLCPPFPSSPPQGRKLCTSHCRQVQNQDRDLGSDWVDCVVGQTPGHLSPRQELASAHPNSTRRTNSTHLARANPQVCPTAIINRMISRNLALTHCIVQTRSSPPLPTEPNWLRRLTPKRRHLRLKPSWSSSKRRAHSDQQHTPGSRGRTGAGSSRRGKEREGGGVAVRPRDSFQLLALGGALL